MLLMYKLFFNSYIFDKNDYFDIKQDVFVKHKCPPLMANSKDGLGHKDKYLDTSRKILSQKMLMCNMKALIFII